MQGKTRPTRHVCFSRQSTYVPHTLPVGGLRTWQPFAQSLTDLNRSTAKKKGSRHNSHHAGWPIHGFVPTFSPTTVNKIVGKSQTSIDNRQLGLLDPYHRHTIGTFNAGSRGPTHRSLTDSDGGYNLEGAGFPRTTPRPSQPTVFTFDLRVPLSL
jgi:hypothetical protein